MTDMDGKIRIGVEFGTKEARDSLQDLSKNLDAVKNLLKTLDTDFKRTSDRATFEKQASAFDTIKAKLIVLAKEYQALNDIIQKSGSSWGSNPVLENMANSYKLQFSRIMRNVLEFKAKLKAQFDDANMGEINVGFSLDEAKFNKFVSDLTSSLAKAADKAGKEFNITPDINLSSVQSELAAGLNGGKSSYRIIAESMNFSDLGADIKRDFVGSLQNTASAISQVQGLLNNLRSDIKNTYVSETFVQQYNDLKQIASEIPELQNRFIQLLGVISQLYDGKLPSSVRHIASSFTEMSNTASKSISQIRTALETNLSSSDLDMVNSYGNMFVDDFSFSYDDSEVRNLVEDLQRDLDSAELNVQIDLDSIELGADSVDTGGVLSVIRANTERISNSIPKSSGTLRFDSSSGIDTASPRPSNDELIAQLEQDQLRAVEKFNEARRQGVDITQALTQDEIALTRSYYEGLKAEERRNQERAKAAQESAKQQRNEKFNAKVDKVVASAVVDLPKEESKIERLNRLAEEVKVDFANEAEISQVKAKFGELKRLASEIKIELTYNNNLSAISNQLGTVKKAADGIRFNFAKTGDIEQARTGVDALKNKISELKAQRDSLNDAYKNGIISEIEFRADTVDIDRAIDELESETVQIEAEINASSSGTMDLSGIADSLSGKLGKVKMILSTTVEAMKKLFEFADYMVGEFEEAVDTAKKLNSALKKVASASFDLSRGILAFSHDALEALGITEQLNDTMSSIGFGDLVGADLLADAIRELSGALKDFSNDALDSGSAFQSYYLRISDIFGESKNVIYDYAKTSIDMLGMSETAYMEAASKIGVFAKGYIKDTEDLTNVTAGLTTAIADLSAQTGFTIAETMTKMLSGIRGNTEAIEELGINVKVADLQTWLDTEGINAKFENLNSTMQNLYRTWYILDKVQANGTMGYASKMMGTYSGQVRVLQAQLDDLKTTIGTYLMQALVPVLQLANMVLSRLIDIANTVGKAFGFLDKYSFADSLGAPDTSGVSDIYSSATDSISGATTAQEELAKATDKTAKAAKKALAPFHQLNILQNNDSASSSTPTVPDVGGLGSVVETIPALDTKPAETAVSEWLAALKKAINDGEWYEVGHLLGQKVNEIVDKLDFKKYREKLYNGVLSLAEIFNGLVETIDFKDIGTKLGDGVNTIVTTINLFLDNINFEEVGTSISQMLRSFMATADWDQIGKLWSQKTRVLLDILHGFVTDMNLVNLDTVTNGWQELGKSLGEFVNSALDLEWERLGTDIGGAINGVADTIISFNETVDFSGIASRLATGFNNLVSTLDGEKIGKAIADTLNSAIGAVGTFFNTADFITLGIEIGDAIGSALANINWDEAADTAIAIADGILSLLTGAVYGISQNYDKIFEGVKSFATSIVDWINDPENQDTISNTINTFVDMLVGLVSAIDWGRLYEGIKETLDKIDWADIIYLLHLGEGIEVSLKSIFGSSMLSGLVDVGLEFIGELFKELGSGILDAIKGLVGLVGTVLLGIPATLLAKVVQIGASIVDGIIEGITGKASNLREKVDEFFQGIIDWVKDLFGIHPTSTVFAEIGGSLIEGLLQGIQAIWGTITEFFSTAITNLTTAVSTGFTTLKTGVETILTNLGTAISTIWNGIKTAIETVLGTISTVVSTAWNGIKTTVSTIVTGISTVISTVWNGISTAISTVLSTISTTISTVWNGISTAVSTVVTTIKNTVSRIFTTLSTSISTIFRGIKSTIVGVFEGITTAIKKPINAIIGLVESMANAIIDGINLGIGAINKLSVDVPDWVPEIGGKTFGFNIPELKSVSIPRLADGAVIQPNHRFLAELGDQTRGVNIETPLNTMLEAFRGALANGNYGSGGDITIPVYIGSELIDEVVVDANNRDTYRNNGR